MGCEWRGATGALCLVVSCTLVATTREAYAANLVETAFDCPDWNQSMGFGDGDVCALRDGISGSGAWTTVAGSKDQITLAANRPGSAGKGFRHWRGDGYNNVGGGLRISLPTPVREMWVRFYMRYQAGFSWQHGRPGGTKENYWHAGSSKAIYFGFSGGVLRFVANGYPYESSLTWNAIMGGTTGDGTWHAYEYYVKADTNGSGGVGNGLGKIWVDGVLVFDRNNLNWNQGPWDDFVIGSNQETPINGVDMYTDYDDVAVSTTGRIGCCGGDAGTGATDAGPVVVEERAAAAPDNEHVSSERMGAANTAAPEGNAQESGCSASPRAPWSTEFLLVIALLIARRRTPRP